MHDATQIRDLAYRLWEEEGRPEGREAQHWLDAERRFKTEQAQAEATPPAKKPRKAPARTTSAAPKRAKPATKPTAQPTR